jgi:outer membrane receptor protein involved in Fe transport
MAIAEGRAKIRSKGDVSMSSLDTPTRRLGLVRVGASGAVMAAALAAALPVAAQEVTPPEASEAEPAEAAAGDDQIVVTGSRIARSGFTAPTPVTVLGQEQIARQGTSNIAQVLNEIPAFRPQSTPATTAIFVSNLGASTADLRGLGGNRTLVLIDGRRVVASTVAGGSFTPANTVDLNLIPASLLERVEVVTGGASAAYGSDAVAGVTNLIINRNLEGLRTTLQFGITDEGDNEEYLVSAAYGTRFADGRGRFLVGAEYVNSFGTGDCYTRDWCAESYNTISNPFRPGSTTERVFAGQPATLILPNARTATASINGLVVGGPLRGTEFNPDGTTFRHDYGQYAGGLFQSGGGDPLLAFYEHFPISAASERVNLFTNLDFDVSDTVRLFAQGSFGHVEGRIRGSARRDFSPPGAYQIRSDNPFLPTSVANQMATAGLATLPFGRIWNDIGPQIGDVTRETFRLVGGFEWELGGSLALDGYYQYGQTDYSQRGFNTTVNSRMGRAIDAVRNTAGDIVCRINADSNPANDDPACVALNPFGAGASSQAARDYVTETAMQDTTLTQHVVALTLRGDILDLWAGPLAFAAGGEYRRDGIDASIDPISAANDFYTSPGGGIVGGKQSLNVKEGFLELALPLARDLPFARSAELNGAVRVTDYSNSGRVETWKIGADWEPVEFLRLRGTRSRDIRAPNLFELYGAPQSSFQTVDERGVRGLYPTLLSGNAALLPEVADTWTAGAVITAGLGSAGRLRLSADWFDIALDGAISTLGAQTIVNRCAEGNAALCEFVTRDAAGGITQIVNPQLNLNTLITRGWDFEADYTMPLDAVFGGSEGDLNFRVLGTYVKDLITIDTAGVAIDRAGQNGSGVSQPSGVPDYTVNGFVTYRTDAFSAQVQVRHISSGLFQVTSIGPHQAGYSPLLDNSVSDNKVEAVTYVNLNAQVRLWEQGKGRMELFGVVNNLLDKDPPNDLPSSFGPTNNVLYDVVGRSFKVGVRLSY